MRRIVIITLVVVCLLLAGCPQVQMSPPYRQTLEMSSIRVAELNKRCQAGDTVACKEGLAAASKTLDLLVDGLHGEADYDD